MACACCDSSDQLEFPSEIAIHFSGRLNLDKPHVLVFPKVMVCLGCGLSRLNIAESELARLGSVIATDESFPPKTVFEKVSL